MYRSNEAEINQKEKRVMLNFKVSKQDLKTIVKIVNRAQSLGIVTNPTSGPKSRSRAEYSRLTCDMDITACHCNGNPLDLDRLMAADDFNFSHDVCGIARHINRETGQLEDCFCPRFSGKQNEKAKSHLISATKMAIGLPVY